MSLRRRFQRATAVGTISLLGACGGGSDGAPGAVGANGLVARFALYSEAPGRNCESGGTRIDAGLDSNANGSLESNEVSATSYVCNGAAGTIGAVGTMTLLRVGPELAGTFCIQGGSKLEAGLDVNRSGILESNEVTTTSYVCNGAIGAAGATGATGPAGATGVAGSNGLNALVEVASEVAGSNCTYGGRKFSSGLDRNGNGSLADETSGISVSYVCNGAPSADLNWVNVTATTVQAVRNTGYLANNNASTVEITLPANASLSLGDVVRVTGIGGAGWVLKQNAGQMVSAKSLGALAGVNWVARENSRTWTSVASSANGAKLVAAAIFGGQLYTSVDGGLNWVARDTPRNWRSVASSSDGTKLVAVVTGGQIYTSTDSGVAWVARDSARTWQSVASSSDGTKLVAAVLNGQLYTSTDSGANWVARDSARAWDAVASSSDGTKLVAVVTGGQIYTSTDSGVTWVARDSSRNWEWVASSSDGTKLVAVVAGGQIYTSTDSGVTWVARDSVRDWISVASSADGTKLVAAVDAGQLFTSTDSGVTWTARESSRSWRAVATSSDGSKLLAGASGAQLYTSFPSTALGVAGSITGGALDAITLQYIGDGLFTVLSSVGSLTVQ